MSDMHQPRKRESKIALTLGLPALFLCVNPAWAEFTLNWTSDTGNPAARLPLSMNACWTAPHLTIT